MEKQIKEVTETIKVTENKKELLSIDNKITELKGGEKDSDNLKYSNLLLAPLLDASSKGSNPMEIRKKIELATVLSKCDKTIEFNREDFSFMAMNFANFKFNLVHNDFATLLTLLEEKLK